MNEWQPATVEYVKQLVSQDVLDCDEQQLALFEKCAVEAYIARMTRYGNDQTVVVVARNGDEVIYYEDIENGFNVSPVGPNGEILEHRCNQDELRLALNYWIDGRKPARFGPAKGI